MTSKGRKIADKWTPERRARAAEKCRARATHGKRSYPEYRVWVGVRRRCKAKKGYADRGITVCERWRDFENFYRDMGPRPSPRHSIERRNNNLGYQPDNCVWATQREQANNRSSNHFVFYQGQRVTAVEAWRLFGQCVSYATFKKRMHRGWPVEFALECPLGSKVFPRKRTRASPPATGKFRGRNIPDETGNRHGRLVVLGPVSNRKYGTWICQCDCGSQVKLHGSRLRGTTKSCGCFRRERAASIGRASARDGYGRFQQRESLHG